VPELGHRSKEDLAALICSARTGRAIIGTEAVTNETNRELKAAGLATAQGRESAAHLNRALASLEHS
jgi:hypothetical protein